LKSGFPQCEDCIGKMTQIEIVTRIKKCNKCNKELDNNCFNVGEMSFCQECFVCDHCGKGFGKEKVVPLKDGRLLHVDCFNMVYGKKCETCQEYIGGKYLVVGEKGYHPECLKTE